MTTLSPLKPGDHVALIAPASPFALEPYEALRAELASRGLVPKPGRFIGRSTGYLAGSDVERAEDLIRAVTDPEIAAVFCIRGGYGSGRLLAHLPFAALAPHRKIFVGHSDITFLHAAFASQMSWVTFLGPNLMDLATLDRGPEGFLGALSAEVEFSWRIEPGQVLKDGIATGPLFGGNLTCLTHLLGTPFFPNLDGSVLLLEDRGEALYRLDRMLTHLKQSGAIDRLAGVVLGDFTDCDATERVFELVLDVLRPFPYPVVAGLPFGHTTRNEIVPLGAFFILNTYEGVFKAQTSPLGARR